MKLIHRPHEINLALIANAPGNSHNLRIRMLFLQVCTQQVFKCIYLTENLTTFPNTTFEPADSSLLHIVSLSFRKVWPILKRMLLK